MQKELLLLLFACVMLTAACAPAGIYHTVQPGQTLYRIAKTYDIEEARLARVNHIDDPTQLKVNQKIFIPGVTRPRKVPATVSPPAVEPPPLASPPAVSQRVPQTTAKKPAAVKKVPPPSTGSVKPDKNFFAWPVKGKVLNSFGTKDQNVYKGIEISVPKGTPVKAAAAGKVIYSGNAIPGYGNLVILEHSDSYFSVYGYNQQNLVKMDDYVGQGEKIALSGLPPNGQSARLHFEIRRGKSAVDPILYLP